MIPLPFLLAAAGPCGKAITQAAMNQCAGREYAIVDAAMTAQWRLTHAAMKRRDAGDPSRAGGFGGGFGYAAATLASQRAWIGFRDAQCTVEAAEYRGGTAQPMVRLHCLTRLTRERTAQLKDLMWQRGR